MVIQLIADEFNLSETLISKVVRTAPHRYKSYSVRKKSGGGERIIAQPAKEIKVFQRYVVNNIISELPVHDSASAYRKKKNIKQNAEEHVDSKFLLKMDFRNFFPSLLPEYLVQHIKQYLPDKFSEKDLIAICRICFWKPRGEQKLRLSIGAPSSPFISNTLMYDFDNQIFKTSECFNVKYTRYADDLTFSTNKSNVLRKIEKEVRNLVKELKYPKVLINEDKTIHTSKKHHRHVTGLVLSSQGNVSLGRKRKREISVMMHHAITKKLNSENKSHLKGLLAFSHDVEPEFLEQLKRKYGNEIVLELLKGC